MEGNSTAEMNFAQLMAAGVAAQHEKAHQDALEYRTQAFWAAAAESNTVGMAQALRDGAASLSYLEQLDEAAKGARESVRLLADGESTDVPVELKEELAASLDRHARILGRAAIARELNSGLPQNFTPQQTSAKAWGLLRDVEKSAGKHSPDSLHQYRINMVCRHAVLTALSGDRLRAAEFGARGMVMGLFSNMSSVAHADKALGTKGRLRSKANVIAGSGLAIVVAANMSKKQGTRRREWALKKADSLLH